MKFKLDDKVLFTVRDKIRAVCYVEGIQPTEKIFPYRVTSTTGKLVWENLNFCVAKEEELRLITCLEEAMYD